MPVVEAVPSVVRDLEQHLLERLGRDHLAPRRDDEPFELAEKAARIAVGRNDHRPGVERRPRSARACARGSRRPLRRHVARDAERAGQAAGRRRGDGRARRDSAPRAEERDPHATRLRSRRRRAPRTPLAARPAPPRPPRGEDCPSSAARHPRASRAHRARPRSSAREQPWRRAPIESTRTGYGAAPPRSAKPPFRPLAPPAISRESNSRTVMPASASASAHEQPVMPPPTTATSTSPSRAADGQRIGRLGEPVRRRLHWQAILDGSSIDTVLERHATRQLELDQRSGTLAPDRGPGPRRSSSAVSAPRAQSLEQDAATSPSDTAVGFAGSIPKTSSTSAAHVTGVAPSRSNAFVPAESELVISPGTARTSRPSSSAKSAVIRAPLRSRASITSVAAAEPGDDPVARGEAPRCRLDAGLVLGDHKARLADPSRELGVRGRDSHGRRHSRARRPSRRRRRAPHDGPRRRCLEPCRSRRRARPQRGRAQGARNRATVREQARAPTSAIAGRSRSAASADPRRKRRGGGSWIAASSDGKPRVAAPDAARSRVTSPRALRASDTRAPRRRARARPTVVPRERQSFEPHARRGLAHDPRAAAGRPRSRGAPTQRRSVAAASAAGARARRARAPAPLPKPPPGGAASSAARGRGIATARSNRSSRARESFSLYAASRCGEHAHSTAGSPRPPHGHMFMVPTS